MDDKHYKEVILNFKNELLSVIERSSVDVLLKMPAEEIAEDMATYIRAVLLFKGTVIQVSVPEDE